jgi:hypothetical protein
MPDAETVRGAEIVGLVLRQPDPGQTMKAEHIRLTVKDDEQLPVDATEDRHLLLLCNLGPAQVQFLFANTDAPFGGPVAMGQRAELVGFSNGPVAVRLA